MQRLHGQIVYFVIKEIIFCLGEDIIKFCLARIFMEEIYFVQESLA